MADLIRRSYILKIIEMWMKVPSYSESEQNIMRAIDYEVRIAPSAQQWVSVTEGLPKLKESHYVSGWVLCSDNEERICFGRVEENVFGQMIWNCERDGVSGKVVAWMPLPEPYKGGDSE